MSWYDEVAGYIDRNLEAFIEFFFPDAKPNPFSTGIRVNPSPCCNHNDCFSFSRNKNSGYCFSCGAGGTRIQIVERIKGQEVARRELEKFSGIRYVAKAMTDEQRKAYDLQRRVQEIAEKAIQHYHERLLTTPEALEKQTGTNQASGQRGHTIEGLKAFKVGLSGDYKGLYNKLKAAGYTVDELKEAGKLVFVPDGYFVYPYYDIKGSLVRINTKLFYRSCQKKMDVVDGKETWVTGSCHFTTYDLSKAAKEEHERETGHKMAMDGYSTGDKSMAFYFPFGHIRGRRKAILIEGENDAISTWEELQKLPKAYAKDFVPIGIGGRADDNAFREPFLRQFDALYECFDLDEAGDGYRNEINEKVPDVPVYTLNQDPDFKDIDQFLKSSANKGEFQEWIDRADFVDTKDFLIERVDYNHVWVLKNRKYRLEFIIESFSSRTEQIEGTLFVYKSGILSDKRTGILDKMKLDNSITPAKLALSVHLEEYYNNVQWLNDKPKRTFWELCDIFRYTKQHGQAIKQLAWYLHTAADSREYEQKVAQLHKRLAQKSVAEVLREVNGFANASVDPNMLFPKIQLSQFFHVTNDDAFFYFSRIVQEGETTKLVPCLLTNKKEEIRLDLLKRKDEQCLLLIKNRYELTFEVPTAVMDNIEVSLQPYWVDRWKNDDLDPEDYAPKKVIVEIENFIRRFYYTSDEIIKVLSLWIYATYYYMLFRDGFPYLIFNGPKGSGKSTFDSIIYLLALNPKFALDMSEAVLFRTISFEGGTFILDEVEDLTDKKSVNASNYAKILKGGYTEQGYVYRMNMDKGMSERFSVFGPKVISNISGIEDVIGDRCIYVKTVQAPEIELRKLERIQLYKEERRSEVHAVTSRCAISALTHFREVNERFNNLDSRLDTGNARLTQILRPLLTIANLVGGDYAEHLMNYYDKEIRTVKDEIAAATTEGMLSNILKRISEEFVGIEKEKWATDHEKHLYTAPIRYSQTSGIFEVDSMHLKVLCEEISNAESVDLKIITSTLKNVLGPKFDHKNNRKQTSATIDDEGLQRQLGGRKYVRVYRYILNVDQFVDRSRIHEPFKPESSLF